MRLALAATLAVTALATSVLGLGSIAAAQPAPQISVEIGAPLAAKARLYGPRDLETLRAELRDETARALAGAQGGPCRPQRVAVTLVDAVPNHPTFQQLSDNPGLDMLRSRSLGGADIIAQLQCADGRSASVHESYYETDIRMARLAGIWGDADAAINRTAWRIAHGPFDRP